MKAVVIGIVVKENKVLVVRRKMAEGNLCWQFPGGTVEGSEKVEDTIIRELKEETGIDARIIKVLGAQIHPYTQRHITYIACEYMSGELQISDNDLDRVEWIESIKLKHYFTTPIFHEVYTYLVNLNIENK